MTMMDELADLMPHTIAIKPFSSDDKYGDPAFGASVNYTGQIEQKSKLVRDLNGKEVVSQTRVYLNTTTVIGKKDEVTLPSGYDPQTPPIINVEISSDENGIQHAVIFL